MRSGTCTMQQALTPEASSIVKQSLTLARRRGHAQVTPLHVATTMLSSPTGLFTSACQQCHSHYPLQCKALELCFNVALNRLPASSILTTSPHHHHHHLPSLSNALVAAFKRAQAHQRRGSIETQQQTLLTVKIELEQLIISILDDPSVSRVMREAGFSSTQVKANVEKAIALETGAPSAIVATTSALIDTSEDVKSVMERLTKKKSVVIIGECLGTMEKVVRGVIDRVERSDHQVSEVLRNIQFINLPLSSFRGLGREDVEKKVSDLKRVVMSCAKGVVLYLGDLKWVAEYRANRYEHRDRYYCPIEHVIAEIRGFSDVIRDRFWVVGIAVYQTYMKCKVGNPSLESALEFHPITVPSTGLELSLNCDSASSRLFKRERSGDGPSWCPNLLKSEVRTQLTCCYDCTIKFEKEARGLPKVSSNTNQSSMINSNLPSWLQRYKEENTPPINDKEAMLELCKKWNSICNLTHKNQHDHSPNITIHFSSISPSSSISTYDQPFLSTHRSRKISNLLGSSPNSTSSSDTTETEHASKFKEVNAENLKILCNVLEKSVPWQREIIPGIASTILQCRSGMMNRRDKSISGIKREETWLCFQGRDTQGKEKISRELANTIFGSYANFVKIELGSFLSTKTCSSEDRTNKRSRSEASDSHLEQLYEAIVENPHRVFLVEDIVQMDSYSHNRIKAGMEMGKIQSNDGEEISTSDAIIILGCESLESSSKASSPPNKNKVENNQETDIQVSEKECFDLNLCISEEDNEDCFLGFLELVNGAFFFKLADDL